MFCHLSTDGDGDSQKAAKRVKTETGTCVIWQWQGDGEIWKDYSSDLAKEISNAFSKGDQKTAFTIGASKFEVIFGQMVQRNVKTGWERNIRVKPDNDYDSVTPDGM